MFKKGQIIWGERRDYDMSKAYHPIIFLEDYDDMFFIGAMLTSSRHHGNIKMKSIHFQKKMNSGRPQYLVKNLLLKKLEWEPFKVINELTMEGIAFVESEIGDTDPILWEEYLSS